MRANIGPGTATRYAERFVGIERASACLREFKRLTDGLTGRLDVPSLASMRAGFVRNPLQMTLTLLIAGRRAGLSRAWAEQVPAWLRTQIDDLWQDAPVPLREARRLELVAESAANAVELAALQAPETVDALRAEIDAELREIAAGYQRIAAAERRIRELAVATLPREPLPPPRPGAVG